MVADGQGNLVTRDTLHQWQSVSDQNVSSMAHVAARDFGFLTLTRPSTARIYNQTRVSCSRCHPGRACRRQRTFALRRPRCGQRTECRRAADEAPTLTPSCAQSAASAGYRHLKQKDRRQGHGFVIGADGTNNCPLLESPIRSGRSALAALDCIRYLWLLCAADDVATRIRFIS